MDRRIAYRELDLAAGTTADQEWVSAPQSVDFDFTELVASWQADTPDGGWIEVAARVGTADGWSKWYCLADWSTDPVRASTSVTDQRDLYAEVDCDTVTVADGRRADRFQLWVNLRGGAVLRRAGAMASRVPRDEPVPVGEPGPAAGHEVPVPGFSQRIHGTRYAQWDGGGGSWCSPTSTSMILGFWGAGPAEHEYDWVDPQHPDRHVVHAVRGCYDRAYGAGNWSFNAAYAGSRGMHAFVTRLGSLTEAEQFIATGIPLVASVKVDPQVLTGAGYASVGHLVVIAGFTETGDVVCFDPAADDPQAVRRVYPRAAFAHAWGASGGIVYVIHPPAQARPAAHTGSADGNW